MRAHRRQLHDDEIDVDKSKAKQERVHILAAFGKVECFTYVKRSSRRTFLFFITFTPYPFSSGYFPPTSSKYVGILALQSSTTLQRVFVSLLLRPLWPRSKSNNGIYFLDWTMRGDKFACSWVRSCTSMPHFWNAKVF